MQPGPLIPQQPQKPRPLTTARDVIVWVILQDAMGGAYRVPVTVPEGVVRRHVHQHHGVKGAQLGWWRAA
jgi:hypothetical protein